LEANRGLIGRRTRTRTVKLKGIVLSERRVLGATARRPYFSHHAEFQESVFKKMGTNLWSKDVHRL